MRHYRKSSTDHNQAEITRAFQKCGYHVTDLSGTGGGVPDLLITRNGIAVLVEIKNKAGRGKRFTPAQLEYYQQVQCDVFVVCGVDDAERLIKGEIDPVNDINHL